MRKILFIVLFIHSIIGLTISQTTIYHDAGDSTIKFVVNIKGAYYVHKNDPQDYTGTKLSTFSVSGTTTSYSKICEYKSAISHGETRLDYVESSSLVTNKPTSIYFYVYHNTSGGYTTYDDFSFTVDNTKNNGKSESLNTMGTFSGYYSVMPIYKISSLVERFSKVSDSLRINVSPRAMSSFGIIENPSLGCSQQNYIQVKLASQTDASYIDIPVIIDYKNSKITIPYSSIYSALGNNGSFIGKECKLRLKFAVSNHVFYSASSSFYYLPALGLSNLTITQPTCPLGKGSISANITNLPSTSSDSLSFLYLIYKYGSSLGTSTGISDEDKTIDGPKYFESILFSGNDKVLTNNLSIPNIPEGIYKVKIYCLVKGETEQRYPASQIFEISPPPVLYNNSSILNNYGNNINIPTGSDYTYIKLSATGGRGPYSYSLDNGSFSIFSSGQIVKAPITGSTLKLTVKWSDQCVSEERSFSVKSATPVVFSNIKVNSPDCNSLNKGNSSNGSVDFEMSGGIPNYRVECVKTGNSSNSEPLTTIINQDLNTIITSSYSSINKDELIGLYFTAGVIKQEDALITICNKILLETYSPTDCRNAATRLIQGLTSLKTYKEISLNTTSGKYSANIPISEPGKYTLYAVDKTLGPIKISDEFVINAPPVIAINFNNVVQPVCFNEKGSLSVSIKNYNLLDVDSIYATRNGIKLFTPKTTLFSGLLPNSTYTFYARNKSGCSTDTSIIINPTFEKIRFSKDSLPSSCRAADNGEIIITNITGGSPFSNGYKIKVGNTQFNTISTSHTVDTLFGTYNIVVSDSRGCLSDITPITVDTLENPIRLPKPDDKEVLCSSKKASIEVSVTPGDRPASAYTYSINGENKPLVSGSFPGLSPGTYTFGVLGSDGCYREANASVIVRADSMTWGTVQSANTACSGVATGELNVNIVCDYNGGNYAYRLTGSNGKDITITTDQKSSTFKNLPAFDRYQLTVANDSGCSIQKSPMPISANPTPVYFQYLDSSYQYCDEVENGFIRLKAKTRSDFTIAKIINTTGVFDDTLSRNEDALLDSIGAGNYTFLAVDNVGCLKDTTIRILNIRNDPRISINIIDSLACSSAQNGIIKISPTQPQYAGKYSFTLNSFPAKNDSLVAHFFRLSHRPLSNKYNLNVTDSVGCGSDTSFAFFPIKVPVRISSVAFDTASCIRAANAGVNLEASGSLPGNSGFYFVLNSSDTLRGGNVTFGPKNVGGNNKIVLYDKYGCSDNTLPVFSFPVRRDSLNIDTINHINPACPAEYTGSLKVNTHFGKAFPDGYNYNVYRNGSAVIFKTERGEQLHTILGLPKGSYVVEVTDKDNCQAFTEAQVLADPDTVRFMVSPGYVAAKGASTGWIDAKAFNGNGKYNVEWYRGELADFANRILLDTTNFESGIKNLAAGDYLVRVKDTASCRFWNTEWLSRIINVPEPDQALSLSVSDKKQVSCYGLSDGVFTLEGKGGWGQSYLYDTLPDPVNRANPVFENLRKKQYTFFVKDTSGIITSLSVDMTQPDSLRITDSRVTDANCFGSADGKVHLTVSGGNNGYSVSTNSQSWEEGSIATGLTAGNYVVTVRDTLGCWASVPAIVYQPAQLVVTDTAITNTQCKVNEGVVEVVVDGGIPSYRYSWTDSEGASYSGNSKVQNLYSGQYTLRVTDDHNCPRDFTFYVSDVTDLEIDTLITNPVACWEGSDGSASVSIAKGFPPYSIIWPGNVEGPKVSGLQAGDYLLKVLDSEGCKVFRDFTIGTPDSLWLNIDRLSSPLCYGVADGIIEVAGAGGTPGYDYYWSTGRQRANVTDLDTGMYYVTVTDKNNCKRTFGYRLNYQEQINGSLPEKLTICKDNSYPVSPGSFYAYSWKKDNTLLLEDSILYVSGPGKYSVDIQDYRGCKGSDSITVFQTDNVLKAQFLMASAIRQNDTLIVFESSDPLPDSISVLWSAGLREVKSDRFYKYLIPVDTGKYVLTLISYLNGCQDIITKELLVLPPGDGGDEDVLFDTGIIKELTLFPNPSEGDFKVEIDLKETSDVWLRLVSFGTGKTEVAKKLTGNSRYLEEFYLSHLLPGMYLLNIQAGDEMRNLKLIIR